jgi:hypothetical protein
MSDQLNSRKRLLRIAGVAVSVLVFALIAGHIGSANAADALAAKKAPKQATTAQPESDVLAGKTQQGWPVFFKIEKRGRQLAEAEIGLHMMCTSGQGYSTMDGYVHVPIAANGKLSGSGDLAPTTGSDGTTYGLSSKFTATLSRNHARLSGTWDLHETFIMKDGTRDECDSGSITFAVTA